MEVISNYVVNGDLQQNFYEKCKKSLTLIHPPPCWPLVMEGSEDQGRKGKTRTAWETQ
jgi:hypothetical protein